jgi:CHAD domain.
MTFHLKHDDTSVEDAIKRVALSQIKSAIAEIDDERLDLHATVHQVRKRCKKLRGVIRLVRPAFADYKRENRAFRDAAAQLSFIRDAQAMIETYDVLMTVYDEAIDRRTFASIRRRLTERKKRVVADHSVDRRLSALRETMMTAGNRAEEWTIDGDGFSTVAEGMAKTYRRAGKAIARARAAPTPENLHELRKRAKYHTYHTNLLRSMWAGPLQAHRDAADRLGGLLGEHHNLAVFKPILLDDPDSFGKPEALEAFVGLIEQRQETLAADALATGQKVFAEQPSALCHRWAVYWQVWREG